jgi:hypothetical protein
VKLISISAQWFERNRPNGGHTEGVMVDKKKEKRKVLVILSNRFNRWQKPKYIELACKADGTILKQVNLKSKPPKPVYDEVWENDEGRTEFDSCTRFKRHYNHALQKR